LLGICCKYNEIHALIPQPPFSGEPKKGAISLYHKQFPLFASAERGNKRG